jgi:hypothetical protein
MEWIALLQPSDLAAWRSAYFEHVRTPAEVDEVAARAWAEFQEYLAVAAEVTEEDFRDYIRLLAHDRTYAGWRDRREAVRHQLCDATGIPFDYLRDTPIDWRPATYDIDFAALHPEGKSWLAIKGLPDSTRSGGGPGVPARMAGLSEKHREFTDKWGTALVLYYDPKRKSAPVRSADVELVKTAWDSLAGT